MKKIILLPAVLFVFSCTPKMTPAEEMALEAKAEQMVEETAENAEKDALKEMFLWQYSDAVDEMTSKKNYFARITSPDVAEFDFPYGSEYMTMTVRNMNGSDDVLLEVTDGQFHEEDYNNPTVTVRFDDAEATAYSVDKSADGSSKLRFILNSDKFIKNLKAAKTLKIQAQFYNQGNHIFGFDVKGLKWEH